MNEFEWLRQTRALNTPVAPARDLWTDIRTRLDTQNPRDRSGSRRQLLPWSMAAAVVLMSVMAGSLSLHQTRPDAPVRYAQATSPSWTPTDPRLSGAAIELHAARSELTQALQQAPNAVFLQRLLQRTTNQRSRLQRLDHETG